MIKGTKKLSLLLFSTLLPIMTLAQPPGKGGDCGATFCNPLTSGDIPALLAKVLHLLVQIGIPVLVIFIVYAGLLFVTAQGSSEKITKARSALLWTVIGGAILLGSQILADVINKTVSGL